MKDWLEARKAAEYIGVSYATLNRMVATEKLSVIWVGGNRRFKLIDLDRINEVGTGRTIKQ